MSDPKTAPGRLERLKSGVAILGAVAGAITGLWGIYEKVRTEARKDTATSYNTLAPQMNQLSEALKQLQLENQQLREVVAQHQDKPRLAQTPPARRPAARKPAGSAGGPAAGGAPAAQTPGAPAAPSPGAPAAQAPGAPAAGGAPGSTPGQAPPPSGAPTTAAGTPPPAGDPAADPNAPEDPVTGLLNTVSRTRAAIETLRKVPESFDKVVGGK